MIAVHNLPQNQMVIEVSGDFDAETATLTRDQFEDIAATHIGDITIDLAHSEFLDSSGIGAIVFLYKRLKARNQNLGICGASGQPIEIIKMLRIDRAIDVRTNSDWSVS